MDIFEKIEMIKPSFTKTDMAVYNAMKDNYVTVFQNSSNALAKKLNVSQASIIRFCKKLDFEGYNDFRFALYDALKNNDNSEKENKKSEAYKKIINIIEDELSGGKYDTLIRTLEKSETVYIYGMHRSALPGTLLSIEMQMRGKRCYQVDLNYAEQWNRNLTDQDAVILFSETSDWFKNCLEEINEMKKSPATVLICMNTKHALRKYFDEVIVLPNSVNQNLSVNIDPSTIFCIFVDYINGVVKTVIKDGKENEN